MNSRALMLALEIYNHDVTDWEPRELVKTKSLLARKGWLQTNQVELTLTSRAIKSIRSLLVLLGG